MTRSTAEHVHDQTVLHSIRLNRFSTGVVHKTVALSNRIERSAMRRLLDTDSESVAGARLEQLLAEIRTIQAEGWAVIRSRVTDDLSGLAGVEVAFAEGLVALAPVAPAAQAVFSGAPAISQVMAAVNARPFQGRFLKDWLADAEVGAARRVRDAVRQGFVEGQTTPQIVRALRGTAAAGYKDGLLEGTRRGVEAMVRTAVTHTADVAHQETYKGFGVDFWRFVATLDGRTTLTCAGLHGSKYPVGKGPRPPRHVGCRSCSVPVLAEIPGVEPFEMPSYQVWLARQPLAVQDEILGVAKGKLFRDGGLTIDRFTDKTGRILTLDQLKARDASAFAKAGLS